MFDFDSNIVKMTKEQFVEAESIAYLIENEFDRKLAFANTCVLFVFKNYVEKNKFKYAPVTNMNLFRVPAVAAKYGISDLYLGDIRVDVRVSLDGKVFPIPKSHINDSLAADYYVAFKGTKNPLKCQGLGYIKKEDLVYDSQDSKYYYVSTAILNPLSELKKEINNIEPKENTFYEVEHRVASENYGAFLDGELDEVKSLDLIKHLLVCEDCRGKFVEYSFLEDVLRAVKHYPELKEEIETDINSSEIPVEEVSAEEAPIEETPVEEAPIEETPAEEAPSEEIPQEVNSEEITTDEQIPLISEEQLNEDEIFMEDPTLVEEPAIPEEPVIPEEHAEAEIQLVEDSVNEEEPIVNEDATIDEPSEDNTFADFSSIPMADDNSLDAAILAEQTVSDAFEVIENNPVLEETTNENIIEPIAEIETNNDDTDAVLDFSSANFEGDNQLTDDDLNINEVEESIDINTEEQSEVVDFSQEIEVNQEQNDGVVDFSDSQFDENQGNEEAQQNLSIEGEVPTDEPDTEENKTISANDILVPLEEETSKEENQSITLDIDESNDSPLIPIDENPVSNSDYGSLDIIDNKNDSIQLESFDANDIKIEQDVKENLQNDEELQKILEGNTVEQNSGWNQVFTKNNNEQQKDSYESEMYTGMSDVEPTETYIAQDDIGTLYDRKIVNESEDPITIDDEKTYINGREKKNNSTSIIVISSIVLLSVVAGGFMLAGKIGDDYQNNSVKTNNTTTATNLDDSSKDMNRVMTDAFSDSQTTLEISKIEWLKSEKLVLTPELKNYLYASAETIRDDLNSNIMSVQGYEATAPSKLVVKINNDGSLKDVKIGASCGSKEIDELILQTVKSAIEKMPPSTYSVKGNDINLVLVVNF